MKNLRSLFPIANQKIYLFNGNIIPCSTPVQQAMQSHLEQWTGAADGCFDSCVEIYNRARRLFAELINAPEDSILSTHSTTCGLNLASLMIQPQAQQNVVVTELEHICNVHPWLKYKKRGVEIRYVPARNGAIELDEYEKAVDDDTAAVSICHVTMNTGFRWDLKEATRIAHEHGAKIVVDAAQSAGAVPIDVRDCEVDFLAAPTYKWLLGPMGAGFCYVCPRLVDEYDPPHASWLGVERPFEIDLREAKWFDSPRKFQTGGMPPMICFAGAAAGMKILRDAGQQNVYGHIAYLCSYLYDGLQELGLDIDTPAEAQRRAGIVAIKVPNWDHIWQNLEEKNIHVGNWAGYIRIDPGCYNTTEEIDSLLGELGRLCV
jgi:selenocysteine lyase/cysteine desulfurase